MRERGGRRSSCWMPASGWRHIWHKHHPYLQYYRSQWPWLLLFSPESVQKAILESRLNITSKHCMHFPVFPIMQDQSIYWLALIGVLLLVCPWTRSNKLGKPVCKPLGIPNCLFINAFSHTLTLKKKKSALLIVEIQLRQETYRSLTHIRICTKNYMHRLDLHHIVWRPMWTSLNISAVFF